VHQRALPFTLASLLLAACATQEPVVTPVPETKGPVVEETEAVQPVPVPAPPTAEQLAAERKARQACARVTFAAVGDIMLGTDYPKNHLPDDDGVGFLAEVTPVLSAADVAFGNLEGVLMDGGEPVKKCKDPDACYLFRSPAHYADRLASAGIDVVSLANNHARDFGEEGRTASMLALDVAAIRHTGRVGDIASWRHDEWSVAVIAFAPFTNSYPMLELDTAAREVAELADKHDLVVVSFHGGAEGADADRVPFTTERYYGENRGDVVQFAHTVIDSGADLVIGHGPHVPRAMELYRERLVAYSLGNFATYYGISVSGAKGYAPILLATLDATGRFVEGEVVSTIQIRPDGPMLDRQKRAYRMIRSLTEQDFPDGQIQFLDDGRFLSRGGSIRRCVDPMAIDVDQAAPE
jgi:poly-gamma-glutamate capsule biosynthesis protein CapA/YwtB (metallophosphatase superfamily)